MKKPHSFLEAYASRLSGGDLRFLLTRLSCRASSDLAEALDLLSGTREMDRWLGSARTCWELYDMLDLLQSQLERAYRRPVTVQPAARVMPRRPALVS
jgi:hypothetical protein